jgi:exonuclease SbcC
MIPVNLKMRNFMPYKGDTPALSFAGIHTACISGDNGSGKSSIIDAITWALWGKTRARSDDELIHQGENEIEVEFDFSIGGQLYRIIRKHTKAKSKRTSGQGSLDLFIDHEGMFTPISGNTKTQTEQKVTHDILRMDYDTFINSAYLRQSHADEFTRQTPSRRKEVLANILNLSIYDDFERCSKEKTREAENEKLRISTSIETMETELAQKPSWQSEFGQAQAILDDLEKTVDSRETAIKQLGVKIQEMEAVQSRCSQLAQSISQYEKDLLREQKRLEQAQKRTEEYQKLIKQQKTIEEGYKRFNQTKSILEILNQKARQYTRLKDKQSQLEKVVDRAQAKLNADHRVMELQINQFETRAGKLLELNRELNSLQPKHKELAQLESFINAQRQRVLDIRTMLSRDTAEISRLQHEIGDTDNKLKMLSRSNQNASCPLCESELGEQKLELVRQKYDGDKSQKKTRVTGLEAGIVQGNSQLKILEGEITRFEAQYKQENDVLRGRIAQLTQSIKEANDARSQLDEQKQQSIVIEEMLATKNYAIEEHRLLEQISSEIEYLDYNEARLESTQGELEEVKLYEQQKFLLDEAVKLLPQEKENLIQVQEAILELKQRQQTDEISRQGLLSKMDNMPKVNADFKIAENELAALMQETKAAQERKGSLKQKLDYLTELESKLKEKNKSLDELSQKENIYSQLAQIFGKKGIQAMLIETALPEIEEEANRLLARMTDNRMHITFQTQQPTKKGDLQETLSILIADELGTRDYELFSGGEAFRIDFAIRIALSRLLARRAGAPLPTLIIDEGFGTQDADGIEKLKEAINSIQDDFEKIIVITHIEELKDAFPTRINVVKTPDGSIIEVS